MSETHIEIEEIETGSKNGYKTYKSGAMTVGRDQSKIEVITERPIELVRSRDGEFLRGYAIVFYDPTKPDTEYTMGKGVKERIAPDALDSFLSRGETVEMRYNHSKDFVLASTENDLSITRDSVGLRFEMRIDPEDIDHKRAKQKIEKQIVKGMSFAANGFTKIQRDGSGYIRTIERIDDLEEISLVHKPAYKGTSVFIRSEIEDFEKLQERIEKAKKLA